MKHAVLLIISIYLQNDVHKPTKQMLVTKYSAPVATKSRQEFPRQEGKPKYGMLYRVLTNF